MEGSGSGVCVVGSTVVGTIVSWTVTTVVSVSGVGGGMVVAIDVMTSVTNSVVAGSVVAGSVVAGSAVTMGVKKVTRNF